MDKLEKMKQLIERDVSLDSGLKAAGLDDDIRHLYVESMARFCLSIIEGSFDDGLLPSIISESDFYCMKPSTKTNPKCSSQCGYCNLQQKRTALDLDELEQKLDEALNNETPESLKQWLKSKRSDER